MTTLIRILSTYLLIAITGTMPYAQTNPEYPEIDYHSANIMYGRQSFSRGEALGRTGVAFARDASAFYLNPAIPASAGPVGAVYTNKTSFYSRATENNNAHDLFVYTRLPFLGTAGIGYELFSSDIDEDFTQGNSTITIEHFRLNIGRQILKFLFLGATLNYNKKKDVMGTTAWPDYDKINYRTHKTSCLFLDAGILGTGSPGGFTPLHETIDFGLTVRNVSFSEVEHKHRQWKTKLKLPVVAVAGMRYTIDDAEGTASGGMPWSIAGIVEIQHTVDPARYRNAVRGGIECSVYDMASIRLGYYRDIYRDHGPESGFTYGFGTHFPVYRYFGGKWPVDIRFDYTSMARDMQFYLEDEKNFHVITLGIEFVKQLF